MPVYKRISKKDLEEWICYIKLVCNKILLNPDIIFVSHLIVSLYEYCQVYCYFKMYGVKDEAVNFKVTVDNIKAILDDEDFYATANNFMQVRHLLSHGFISDKVKKAINSLLKNPKFMLLLKEINLDLDAVNCIKEAVFTFREHNEEKQINETDRLPICSDKGLPSSDRVAGPKNNSTVSNTSTLSSVLKEATRGK